MTARLGQQVGRLHPLGSRHVKQRECARAGAGGDAAGIGCRGVSDLVHELGAGVQAADLVDQ